MSIKKIIITGDILRFEPTGFSQAINITWLYTALKPILNTFAPSLAVTQLLGESSDFIESTAEKIYSASAIEPSQAHWLGLIGSSPNKRQIAIIEDAYRDSLVIAFELPEIIRKALSILGIPYIDLVTHPARYLRDVVMGIRTNVPMLYEQMRRWALSDDDLRIEAGYAAATLFRMGPPPDHPADKSIGIFACQTYGDKVLVDPAGKLILIEDFSDALRDMSRRHDLILVRPHPWENKHHPELFLTQYLDNAVLTKENFYRLLIQPNVEAVYSLCSSTSLESRYFGKTGEHLAYYPYKFTIDPADESRDYMPFYGGLIQPDFWRDILRELGLLERDARLAPKTTRV